MPRYWMAALLVAALLTLVSGGSVLAAGPTYTYTFEPHAVFFSREAHQSTVVDPQVFVADPSAAAGVGPEGITHVAGYRPTRPESDPSGAPLFTAQGRFLNLTLGMWLGATGSGTITCQGTTARATNQFHGLIPGGLYQLVRLQFTAQGVIRTPFGKPDGTDSVFLADGNGNATVSSTLPFCPGPFDGVALAFHSDAGTHGAALGVLGVNLHTQLDARILRGEPLPRGGGVPPWIAGVAGVAFVLLGVLLRRREWRG